MNEMDAVSSKADAQTSGLRPPPTSRLMAPGSMTKRSRPASIDLEAGLDAKKMKMGPPEPKGTSNLSRAKSKSTFAINPSSRGRPAPVLRTVTRPSVTVPARPIPDRRATTTAALNRTDKENRSMNREKSTLGRVPPRPNVGAVAPPARRAAWDTKGRLDDMEQKFSTTMQRVEILEKEKLALESDNEVKLEVVQQTSKENSELRTKLVETEEHNSTLKKKLEQLEEEHIKESTRLKRQLENEEFNLERKLRALEDELSSKQTEVSGLKNSVAELSSSRAGLEAGLQNTQTELEAAKARVADLTSTNTHQKSEMEKMVEKLNYEETQRRKLHNMVQELKGNIRVFCRVRPLLGEEVVKYKSINHILINSDASLELVKSAGPDTDSIAAGLNKTTKSEFVFDRVFDSTTSQQTVFDEISQLVQSALDGYNVCVFAYGQTGSGKTFTMEGGDIKNPEQDGMIPKTIKQIFEVTERLREKGWVYTLKASFLEIYNEEIRDLLATEKNLKYEIKMVDSKGSDIYVTNLSVENVTCEGEISSLLRRARKHRAVAETLCNERSSRSHCVFMLRINGTNKVTTESSYGVLNLVDLAGSERLKESGSEGQRLVEAQAINKSLSNLGNVIMALAQKSSHVPYRNSKLTHLLQNSLGGNSKTLMFVNLSPREDSYNETLNSLRFATKVNQCHIGTAVKKGK